jgi:hypothetical protein
VYTVILNRVEYATLAWLADRGYDGGLYDFASHSENPEDENGATLVLDESAAWAFRDYVDEDWHAFLACNGSATLAEKMMDLYNEIV